MANLGDELKQQADREFIKEWTATRARGRRRYILVRGVLQCGSLGTLIMLFGHWLFNGWHALFAAFAIVCNGVGGFIAGLCFWNYYEQRFRNLVEDSSSESSNA